MVTGGGRHSLFVATNWYRSVQFHRTLTTVVRCVQFFCFVMRQCLHFRSPMDRARAILVTKLGEKAASDFIASVLALDNPQDIKKRVGTLLDTRKVDNRQVYEVLIRERERKNAFPQEGYRKTDSNPNALCEIQTGSGKPNQDQDETVKKTNTQTGQSKNKRKPNFQPLFQQGARGDQLVTLLPGRHPCQCLATKHQLINNCTSCGRIVCAQEGSGPCFYCGQLVCSKSQLDTIALGTKQAVKLRNQLLQATWASGIKTPPYRRKRRGKRGNQIQKPGMDHDHVPGDSGDSTEEEDMDHLDCALLQSEVANLAQERLESGLAVALANRDRLLEYDVTSARRTRVLDDEMDYFVSEGSGADAAWLSPEARERIATRVTELRAQRHASRLQTTRLCLDFAGRSVTLEDNRDEAARQLYLPSQEELDAVNNVPSTITSRHDNGDAAILQDHLQNRMIDPTLGLEFMRFLPGLTDGKAAKGSRQAASSTMVTKALCKPGRELRLQDDTSRQLVDEGYCLSMHQPWASFIIRGIKRDEGRTWYSAHRGCLWIAATAKKPDPDDLRDMENDYLQSGGSRANLPATYPTGCLLGRVNVIDVLPQEEYRNKFPDGSSSSPYVLVCNDPRELILKLPISGKHKIYQISEDSGGNTTEEEEVVIGLGSAITHADMLCKFAAQSNWDLLPVMEDVSKRLTEMRIDGRREKQTLLDAYFTK